MKALSVSKIVEKVIKNVKRYGDKALLRYTIKFDQIKNFSSKDLKVKIEKLPKLEDKNFIKSINLAIKNIRKFHMEELKNLKRNWSVSNNGIKTGQKFLPVDSVGIYIPGGKYGFNYISTLLMTVIPAQVAGVRKIVLVTPPKNVTNYFLYTAYILGIKEIYQIGGAQAVAALAFGTKTVPKVDMIVGPGNIWVTEAKRQLIGKVGIDMIAGPSEVVVVGDGSFSLKEIIYELLAQAEHDKDAKSYFISYDKNVIKEVKKYLIKNAKEFLNRIKIIYEKNLQNICKIIDEIAPEHLTLLTKYQKKILAKVKNAGAIFSGSCPSAVFGDYVAGPSHVLPTNSTAKFSSGLCVGSFFKKISIVEISKKGAKNLVAATSILAEKEGMVWHKNRVDIYKTF
ncbi:MAG: histidinol dehydrogenase [Endomicrobiia bacterium]